MLKRPKPVLSSLNVAANRHVLADANVQKLISLAQGYVSVQENAPLINTDFISNKIFIKNKFQLPFCYPVFKIVFITGNLWN